MPERRVRPPAFALTAVRAIAPVIGTPPTKAETMLPRPCPMSSRSASWFCPVRASPTSADSSASMLPNKQMVNAGNMSELTTSSGSSGREGTGIVKGKSPTTCAVCTKRALTLMPTVKPTSAAGTFLANSRATKIAAMVADATIGLLRAVST